MWWHKCSRLLQESFASDMFAQVVFVGTSYEGKQQQQQKKKKKLQRDRYWRSWPAPDVDAPALEQLRGRHRSVWLPVSLLMRISWPPFLEFEGWALSFLS